MSRNQTKNRGKLLTIAVLCAAAVIVTLISAAGSVQADTGEQPPVEFTTNASTVEFGFRYNSNDAYRFGDFTGLDDEGLFFVGNMDLWGRKRFDNDSTRYWRLKASNLGLASRSAHFEYGEQGRYGFSFDFDQMPKLQTDSARTFMAGEGDSFLQLPPGWVGANTPATMPNLMSSLVDLDVDHERRRLGAGLFLMPFENWKLTTRFDRNTKQGTKITGGLVGISGGNPRSVLIPEPIDYTTDEFDVGLEYANRKGQFQMNYHLSSFNNSDDSITWENPYTYAGVWDPAAEWPNGMGRKALPPDNRFDQLTFSGGYNLAASTRVTLNTAFGRMQQDETFLPYTVNAVAAPIPVPRSDLHGEINTTLLNLRIHSRPMPRLTLSASYRYDDRDNETPQSTYIYVPSDATDQGVITDSTARINHNYSSKKNEFELEAGYRLYKHTDLTLGYQLEHIKRTHEEVDSTEESGFHAKLRTRPMRNMTAGLKLGYALRDASTYHHNEPFLTGHSPDYIATQAGVGLWENHPLLRRFYLNDRKREEVGVFGTFMPTDRVSVGLNVSYHDDDYDDPEVGLSGQKAASYSLDLSYTPTDKINTYAFYTLEDFRTDTEGWSFRGFAKAADSVDPTRRWSQTTKDRVNTVGFGVKMQLVEDRLNLGVDYLYSQSNERNNVSVGSSLSDGSIPNAVSRLHNARIGLDYKLRENLTVRLGYLFEKFSASDFAYDLLRPNSLSQVVVTAEEMPDYTNHLFTWSFVYKFW
jgi:MtrB/PioB family decaheme-associated outer membrane protein